MRARDLICERLWNTRGILDMIEHMHSLRHLSRWWKMVDSRSLKTVFIVLAPCMVDYLSLFCRLKLARNHLQAPSGVRDCWYCHNYNDRFPSYIVRHEDIGIVHVFHIRSWCRASQQSVVDLATLGK